MYSYQTDAVQSKINFDFDKLFLVFVLIKFDALRNKNIDTLKSSS